MSFVERNKRWLLPAIGVGVAGVVWMNLPNRSAPAPGTPASAPAPEPRASAMAVEPPERPDRPGEAVDSDPVIQALEAPPAAAYDPAPLILAGRKALSPDLRSPARPPHLHPEQWQGLSALANPKPAIPDGQPAAQPLPPLDFLISSRGVREAWMGGAGYRPGSVVRDGYTLKRITATGVVLSGPSGDLEVPLKASAMPPASVKGKAAQP